MQQAVLERLLEQIHVLEVQDLKQVQRAVEERLGTPSESSRRQAFYRSLRASGLVKQVKTLSSDEIPDRWLIEVEGLPVSETIIEERR